MRDNNVAQEIAAGIMPDIPALALPHGAWTDSRNVRYRDGAVEKFKGQIATLGSLSCTAIFASSITDGTTNYYVYASSTVAYGTNGTTHANVMPTNSLTFAAALDLNFSGGPFHGFMLLNDGVEVPLSWVPGLGNDFTSLTAWPAITAKVLRSHKDFLFAFGITESSVYNGRLIRWSDAAAQGALPASWDYTDPTNQAGITELGQTPDLLVDALTLRDSLIVYKENSTWVADYVGGVDVYGFRQLFGQVGLLSKDCVVSFGNKGDQHFLVSESDIVLHDGNSARSICDGRTRRWFFAKLSASAFARTFVVTDYENREILICFAETGYAYPNLALVWNWASGQDGTWTPRELGGQMTHAISGILPGTVETFDAASGTFDTDPGVFDRQNYDPSKRRVIMFDSAKPAAYQLDSGETFAGTAMTCYAERSGMTLSAIDLNRIKIIDEIYPKILGTIGDTFDFYVGTQTAVDGATTWTGPYRFTIGTDYKIDPRVAGRILSLRVIYTGTNTFRFFGFDIEGRPGGWR